MTDRELIELAAKAAGLRINFHPTASYQWNPLERGDDALRLAVNLGLIIDVGQCWRSKNGPMYGEDVLPCPHAATRRAIVRAAAAIGREMP